MTDTTKPWHFHAPSRMVLGETESDVICFLAPRQDNAVGQLLAAAPAMAAVTADLRLQLRASLDAWEGEEDSVQEEHAELIADLQAAEKRADAILDAPGVALPAETLRALAQALLEQAHQLDGLQPYVVNHSHRHGDTMYTIWSATPPSDKQMASLLEEEFEEGRGETLEYHAMQISEMTGVRASQAPASDDDAEEPELGYGPASM